MPEAGKIRRMAEDEIPMLPIMEPGYNLREMAKQLALLEDHLFQEAKRCPDCIRKHFLTVEALLEEAVTLDESGDLAEQIPEVVDWIRELQGEWIDGTNPAEIAQALRGLRKQVSEDVFDVRELQASCVATRYAALTFTVHGYEYPDDGPHAKLMSQYMAPPDDKYSEAKWNLYRDWAKKRRVSKDDMEAVLEAFDNGMANYVLRGPARKPKDLDEIARRLQIKVGTKSPAEREDEEVERLVRRNPTKKPPRHDLRRERIRVEDDPDIEDLGQEGDKDISRNFKRVGSELISSVIRLHHLKLVTAVVRRRVGSHSPGDTWKSDSGAWYGMSPAGTTQGFEDDQEAAKAFASGGDGEAPEDEAPEDTGPSREDLEKELAESAGNAHDSMADAGLPDAFDQALSGLDEAGQAEMGAAYAEARAGLVGGGLSAAEAEKALSEPYTGSDPKKLGAALAAAEYAKKVTLNPLMSGGPMSPPGNISPPSPEQVARRTTEFCENAKDMSTDQRKEQADGLLEEMKGLDEGTARHAEAKAALQGLQLAAIVDGVDEDDFPGGKEAAPPKAFQSMVKMLASQPGGLALLTAPAEKMYEPDHRALLQQSMNGLSDEAFMEVLGGSDSGPGSIAKMLEDADDPSMRRQLREMAMEWHMDEASILPAIIQEQNPNASPQEITDQLREAEDDQADLERRIGEGYEDDGADEVLRIIEETRRQQVENIRGEDATGPASANADAFLETGDRSQLLTGTDPPLPSPL